MPVAEAISPFTIKQDRDSVAGSGKTPGLAASNILSALAGIE